MRMLTIATVWSPRADHVSLRVRHALGIAALVLFLGNILDATMTIFWVERGLAHEANPLMDTLLRHNVVTFFETKYLLVCLAIALLLRFQERKFARQALFATATAYCALIGYHMGHVSHLMH